MLISESVLGINVHGFSGSGQSLVEVAEGLVGQGKIIPRSVMARISASPLLVKLDGFLHVPRLGVVVMTLDVELLALAGAVAEVVGFLEILVGLFGIPEIG